MTAAGAVRADDWREAVRTAASALVDAGAAGEDDLARTLKEALPDA